MKTSKLSSLSSNFYLIFASQSSISKKIKQLRTSKTRYHQLGHSAVWLSTKHRIQVQNHTSSSTVTRMTQNSKISLVPHANPKFPYPACPNLAQRRRSPALTISSCVATVVTCLLVPFSDNNHHHNYPFTSPRHHHHHHQ